jgi:hypothetical protein
MKSVKDLKGYPFKDPYDGDFECDYKQLTSLEGCPQIVKGDFNCSVNELQSLQYCPQIVEGHFICSSNNLPSLQNIDKYCKQIDMQLWASNNPIKSHVLGVMLIENIKYIILSTDRNNKLQTIENIINSHLKTDRDVFICQDNLIKAGFAEYAQL